LVAGVQALGHDALQSHAFGGGEEGSAITNVDFRDARMGARIGSGSTVRASHLQRAEIEPGVAFPGVVRLSDAEGRKALLALMKDSIERRSRCRSGDHSHGSFWRSTCCSSSG
jgi:hypothetical protein